MEEDVEVSYDKLLHDTGLAYLFLIGGSKVFIAKSLVKDTIDEKDHTFMCPYWLAVKEGFI